MARDLSVGQSDGLGGRQNGARLEGACSFQTGQAWRTPQDIRHVQASFHGFKVPGAHGSELIAEMIENYGEA